ncbi:MAG TPA: thioredoxin domain-containing protein [Streptosporangiaceae bacterium]|nr:thioredoxin domain-containing protein [Streptosporangiaceae bacterium]
MTHSSLPSHVPASATADGDGVVIGAGPVTVDAYIDFLCPFCRQFELSSGDTLAALVAGGQISLAYHPMNFLDAASTTHYSTRAAASAGCASDGGRFAEYAHALFVSQPPEGSAGLTDAQLAGLARSADVPEQAFVSCVRSGRYLEWPPYVTAVATGRGVQATPTVLVNGVAVPASARMIAAAVAEAAAG